MSSQVDQNSEANVTKNIPWKKTFERRKEKKRKEREKSGSDESASVSFVSNERDEEKEDEKMRSKSWPMKAEKRYNLHSSDSDFVKVITGFLNQSYSILAERKEVVLFRLEVGGDRTST